MPLPEPAALPRSPTRRLMWLTPDRVLYASLLGAPTLRTMGSVTLYVAHEGAIRIRLEGGDWQTAQAAVVPPYVPHQVASESRLIIVLHVEAETVDLAALPAPLRNRGAVLEPALADALVSHVRAQRDALAAQAPALDLARLDFDTLFFGAPLPARRLDARIRHVVEQIRRDPSAPLAAEDCAASVHLSFSRFLHLFRQEVGTPFRSFRTWKRARSLLHYVSREANLAHVALDTGYPDSTHFSQSIRQVYGLKPRDIFAGSRRLAVYTQA